VTGATRETIKVVKKNRKPVLHKTNDFQDISRILAANSSDIIIRVQLVPERRLTYVSPACLQVFGYAAQEFYEDNDLGLRAVHPDDVAIFHEFLQPDDDAHRSVILRWIRKDGRIVWTEQTKTVIRNENGEAQEICFIARDITERKMAQERLQESQKFASSLLENAPHAVVVINPDTSLRYVNPAWEETNGWTLSEVVGIKAPYPWWPEKNESAMAVFYKAMEDKGTAEVTALKKNGEQYWLSMNWLPVKQHGELQYLLINSIDITERKQAEEALKQSEDKFAKAFQSSPDAICITTIDEGRFIDVNESLIKYLGYSREEIIGHTSLELNLWPDREERNRILSLLGKNRRVRSEQLKFLKKSGEIMTCLFSAEPTNVGNKPCMISVISDITERKKVEERLRLLSSVTQQVSDATIVLDLAHNITYLNHAAEKMFGYSAKEVLGRPMNIFSVPPVVTEHIRKIFDVVNSGKVWSGTAWKQKKDGTVFLCKLEIGPLYDENGRINSYIDVEHDITELKKVEERLRLVSSVTQQISDATIVLNRDLNITYMNHAAETMFGYSAEEVMGKSMVVFSVSPVPKENIGKIFDVVNSGKVWSGTVQKKKKDGTIITSRVELGPLYDEDGRLSSYINVEHDITEQKAMEARLKEQNDLVESILAAMPEGVLVIDSGDKIIMANQAFFKIFHISKRALANKSLERIIPKDKLSNLYVGILLGQTENNTLEFRYEVKGIEKIISCSASRMGDNRLLLTFTDVSQERDEEEKLYLTDRLASLGEMAAGLAHELNNPLTGILALSQLLVNNHPPEESKEDLQCIFSEAKRAAEIVKNVLLFSRNNNFVSGLASAGEVVSEVLRLRQYEHISSNIAVVTHLQEDLPRISIDKYQLQQVCLNIILNAESAIKETGKPGAITIKTEKTGDFIVISFSDTGCGIKKQVLPRIFDPFFTTKDIGKGTGLGLSICYGIVVKHGGKISVRTRVNEGSTFIVRLPVAPVKVTTGKE
jgi:PAS domain S-box-containing protein